MMLYVWFFTAVVVVVAIVVHYRRTFSRYHRCGVRHRPPLPFLGSMGPVLNGSQHLAEHLEELYNLYPDDRFVGRYEFMRPTVLVRDLQLAREITIKHCDHFPDHRSFADEKVDVIFSKNLVCLKGQEWKSMRCTLSPCFTSAKLRYMVPFMEEVGGQMMQAINKQLKNSKVGYIDVECRDLTSRFSNDVIASCAFGLKVDSHAEQNNKFFEMGQSIAALQLRTKFVFAAIMACPSLVRKLKLTVFPRESMDFFANLFIDTMKNREMSNITRPDLINLLLQEKEAREEVDLVAQAVMFFVAGFETISTALSFTLHELAMNPDVQERLVAELREHHAANGGHIDFSSIQELTYLDMVVSEVLRLWPPIVASERMCEKDFNLGKAHSGSSWDYIVRKGESVNVPIWAIHRDPQYHPNPLKFDPERFSKKNKHLIKPMTYIPFGMGPRNCIGSRLALFEVKIFLYKFLLEVELSPSHKTDISLQLDTRGFAPALKGGHWVRISSRNNNS